MDAFLIKKHHAEEQQKPMLKQSNIQKRKNGKTGFMHTQNNRIYRGLNACKNSSDNKRKRNVRANNKGKIGGIRVHEQVEYVVQAIKSSDSLPLKRPKQFTLQVFAALYAHGLQPIESEYCILNVEKNICTAIDLVCLNSQNEYCIVSLKTGYDSEQLSERTAQEHLQQILFEVETFEQFTSNPVSHAYILYVYKGFEGRKQTSKKKVDKNNCLLRVLQCRDVNDLLYYLKGAQMKKIK